MNWSENLLDPELDLDDPVYIHKPESVITGWDYSDLIEEAEDRIEERRAIYGSEHI